MIIPSHWSYVEAIAIPEAFITAHATLNGVQKRWFTSMIAGKIKPVIERVLLLNEVQRAHKILAKRENFGKLVLALE